VRRRAYDETLARRDAERRREAAEAAVDREKTRRMSDIEDLVGRGELRSALAAARNLHEMFSGDAAAANMYAAIALSLAAMLVEGGDIDGARQLLQTAVAVAADPDLVRRARSDLAILNARVTGPIPTTSPPRKTGASPPIPVDPSSEVPIAATGESAPPIRARLVPGFRGVFVVLLLGALTYYLKPSEPATQPTATSAGASTGPARVGPDARGVTAGGVDPKLPLSATTVTSAARTLPAAGAGTLTIRSSPAQSLVLLDGSEVGSTDQQGLLTLTGVTLGNHRVVIQKDGYSAGAFTERMTAGANDNIMATLKPKGATLTVTSEGQGFEVEIDDVLAVATRASILPGQHSVKISKTGYQTVTTRVDVRPGQDLVLPASLRPIPTQASPSVPETRSQSPSHSASSTSGGPSARNTDDTGLSRARESIPLSTGAAKSESAFPRVADAMVSELKAFDSGLADGHRAAAVERLSTSIGSGVAILILVKHDHRNIRVHNLSPGSITLSKEQLVFTSYWAEDSFAVRWSDVQEITENKFYPDKDPNVVALSVKVVLRDPQGKKNDTRTFNLFTSDAISSNGDVRCGDCGVKIPAYADVIRGLRERASHLAPDPIALDGVYFGNATDSSGRRGMTWVMRQQGNLVSGTVSGGGQGESNPVKGQLSGRLIGTTLMFEVSVPPQGANLYPCAATLTGSASVTSLAIQAVYVGTTSCSQSLIGGKFVLVKGDWPVR
jgi:hypothetical protein